MVAAEEDFPEIGLITGRLSDQVKRSHRAADRLQRDLLTGASAGRSSLGSMAAIRAKYGLGRWACREAIGILELRGVARLRTGRGGGLTAMAPGIGDLAKLTLLHLYVKRASTRELIEARRLVYLAALRHVMERCAERGARASGPRPKTPCSVADDAVENPRSFASRFADCTGNGAFRFMIDFVEALCAGYVDHAEPPAGKPAGYTAALEEDQVWQAIRDRDFEAARTALVAYLAATERVPPDEPVRVRRLLEDRRSAGAAHCARRLAMRLVEEIVEAPTQAAVDLGSELAIGLRHDANPVTVRQAIRLLEDLALAAPRRGRNGGIKLRRPDVTAIIGLIPHILIQDRLEISDCFDAAGLLGVEMTKEAAARIAAPLEQAAVPLHVPDAMERLKDLIRFDLRIAERPGNSALTACERGFQLYAWAIEPPHGAEAVPRPIVERLLSMSRRILERIDRGDVAGAEAIALEKYRLLALRFAPCPAGFSDDEGVHPLTVVDAREQELLARPL